MSKCITTTASIAAKQKFDDGEDYMEILEAAAPSIINEAIRLERERVINLLWDLSGPGTYGRHTLMTLAGELECDLLDLEALIREEDGRKA